MRIDEIRPYERNARHNERAIPKVAESIKAFGLRGTIGLESRDNPVIVCETIVERYVMSKIPEI